MVSKTLSYRLKRRVGKKIIKHAPPRPYIHNDLSNTVYVKSVTPFMSAVKRIEKLISKFELKPNKKGNMICKNGKKVDYITVKGMGKSITKVLNIGVHFKVEQKLKVEVSTKSIGVLDEFAADERGIEPKGIDKEIEEDEETDILSKRNVGSVEIKIYLPV